MGPVVTSQTGKVHHTQCVAFFLTPRPPDRRHVMNDAALRRLTVVYEMGKERKCDGGEWEQGMDSATGGFRVGPPPGPPTSYPQ